MSILRRAKRVDENQSEIVRRLRLLPNVSVSLDHDDILVGTKGKNGIPCNLWFEIKSNNALDSNGRLKATALKPSQVCLLRSWQGHYDVVTSYEEIYDVLLKVWGM